MENQGEKADKLRRNIIIVVFILMAAALAACIMLLLKQGNHAEQESQAGADRNMVMDRGFVSPSNNEAIMDDVSEKVAEGMFECRMTTSWVFKDGESASATAYVANVASNLHDIYFDVYDRLSNELLYSSPIIRLGEEIKDIKLEKKLAKGEYDAVVMYTLVDENYEEVSTVGFNITITINH